MDLESILCCPNCYGDLSRNQHDWLCKKCHQTYQILHGIHDLRSNQAEFEPNIQEAIRRFDEITYQELLDLILITKRLPKRIDQKIKTYYSGELARAEKMTNAFIHYAEIENRTWALDLGCGSGAALSTLARQFQNSLGIDAHFGQLLLARKSINEQLNENEIELICADGEKLPFKSDKFEYIQAINVIEHLPNLPEVMGEVRRCLVQGGKFAGDSRNRYDIFAPEPHTGIRLLGFLPRALIPEYVNWRCDADYENTFLLSWFELKKSLQKVFRAEEIDIHVPDLAAYGYNGHVNKVFNVVKKIIGFREFLLMFFVSQHVTITKLSTTPDQEDHC